MAVNESQCCSAAAGQPRSAQWLLSTCAAALLLAAGSTEIMGMYSWPELVQVPVARAIRNVERALRAHPNDGDAHWALGRLYTIASMEPHREVSVLAKPKYGRDAGTPFLLEKWERFPDTSRAFGGEAIRMRDAQLGKALRHYRRAAKLLPENVTVTLGLAWTLDQMGQDTEAVRLYRRVYTAGKAEDMARDRLEQGHMTLSQEAAMYLLGHLHPMHDSAEIAQLRDHLSRLDRLPRWVTPLAIPEHAALLPERFIDSHAQVTFDLDGSRRGQRWEWITPDASWLVWDPQRSGHVKSGLDLFGSVSFWVFWSNGYKALQALDDDGDGWLRDTELDGLAVWTDRNSNGVSELGEVRPSHQVAIVAIATRGVPGDGFRVAAHAPAGVIYRDGTSRPTYDVVLGPSAARVTSR